ncbi:MAG: tetratricopeptide repeat protein [Acidobacteriaceae bacterium]|nr:tetratricopeptide repeat protein [Acidobacteriaceae bacterium]
MSRSRVKSPLHPGQAAGLLLFACATIALARTDSFDDLSRRAAEAMQADRVPEAIDLYRRAVALRPDWLEGWWHLGTLQYDSGHFVEARDAFLHFVSKDANAGPGFAMLGLCEFELKHYEASALALERGRRLGVGPDPDFLRRVLYTDGVAHTKLARFSLALKLLEQTALRTAAANAAQGEKDALANLALVDAIGLAALRMPRLASELDPQQAALVRQAGRAEALYRLKDWVSAETEFKDLAAAHPHTPGVHYMYGVFLLKVHPDAAVDEFRKEIELSPADVDSRMQIAIHDLESGDDEQARQYAAEAVALQRTNFAAHVVYSRALLSLGHVNEAVSEARIAVRLAPENEDAHLALFRSLSRTKLTSETEHERAELEKVQANAAVHGK